MAKTFVASQLDIQRMQGVHKDLQTVFLRALKIASTKENGIGLTIPNLGGVRTDEEQNALFKQGVSKADGYVKKSFHQKSKYVDGIGKALDVIPVILIEGKKGNQIYSKEVTKEQVNAAFHFASSCMLQAASEMGVKLQWGGNWKFVDMPHYQMI
jgi:peptidoglycan L-alanyl-D-glutamate endopeptidase CwlK